MRTTEIDAVIDRVFALYEVFGHEDYIGEPVSQLEHMSQAAELAIASGASDEVVLAAFFHDIGHICTMKTAANNMDGYGIIQHEKVGADYLRNLGFPETVAALVESHVKAKRYLTWKYPSYLKGLSEASKKTLEFQGGVMTKEEAEAFEKEPYFEDMIHLRKWDEQAKETFVPVIDLGTVKSIARKVLLKAFHTAPAH